MALSLTYQYFQLQEAQKQKQRELSLKRDIRKGSSSNSAGGDVKKSSSASGSDRLFLRGYVDGLTHGSHQSQQQGGDTEQQKFEDSEQWWASAVAAFLSPRGHTKGRHLEQVLSNDCIRLEYLFYPSPS